MAPIAVNAVKLTKFSDTGDYLAVVSESVDKHRLKIWDTLSNSVKIDFPNESSSKFTCLSWGYLTEKPVVVGEERKKRKSEAASLRKSKLIAAGCDDGTVHLFSISQAVMVKCLSGAHATAVTDFCFSNDGCVAYSCGEDGSIAEWDLLTGTMKRCWKSNTALTAICLSTAATTSGSLSLVTAGYSVQIWDLSDLSLKKTLPGHASLITHLVCTANGKWCATIAEQDRFVNIWNLDCSSTSITQLAAASALALEMTPVSLDISHFNGDILVTTEDGKIYTWSSEVTSGAPLSNHRTTTTTDTKLSSKKQRKHRQAQKPDGSIAFQTTESATSIHIILGKFASNESIICARGSVLKPLCESVRYQNGPSAASSVSAPPSSISNGILLERSDKPGILMDNTTSYTHASGVHASRTCDDATLHSASTQHLSYDEKSTAILGSASFVPSMVSNESDERLKETLAHDSEPTIAEKLESLNFHQEKMVAEADAADIGNSITATSKSTKNLPKSGSLHQMLLQALHTLDNSLLEECLAINDQQVVTSTIKRLSSSLVIPLLQQIVKRFNARPGRGKELSQWIRIAITVHMSYLMTTPKLVAHLAPLYQSIDRRLNLFSDLIRLQGRLDVLDIQTRDRREMAQKIRDEDLELQTPQMIYVDDNEEEDEEETSDFDQDEEVVDGSAPKAADEMMT